MRVTTFLRILRYIHEHPNCTAFDMQQHDSKVHKFWYKHKDWILQHGFVKVNVNYGNRVRHNLSLTDEGLLLLKACKAVKKEKAEASEKEMT